MHVKKYISRTRRNGNMIDDIYTWYHSTRHANSLDVVGTKKFEV